jgi:hypothetical protein
MNLSKNMDGLLRTLKFVHKMFVDVIIFDKRYQLDATIFDNKSQLLHQVGTSCQFHT